MKVAVLYGGVSKEREVSISSGEGIMKALKTNGHEVIGIDFHPDEIDKVAALDVDLVFIGLHGKHGEDGSVQGLLDMLGIPYVGSGVLASALAMDKHKAKTLFEQKNLPVPKGNRYRIKSTGEIAAIVEDVHRHFAFPFVVKPNSEGSTLGLTIVQNEQETKAAVENALKSDKYILVEEFIQGVELTIPIIGEMGKESALPIIEIIPKNELYDYESKYEAGGSEHIIPARIDENIAEQMKQDAITAHQILGCEVYSRADFLLTEDLTPYILEVNTLPGMTPTSLFPDSAQKVGMSYEEMIEQFVQLTMNK